MNTFIQILCVVTLSSFIFACGNTQNTKLSEAPDYSTEAKQFFLKYVSVKGSSENDGLVKIIGAINNPYSLAALKLYFSHPNSPGLHGAGLSKGAIYDFMDSIKIGSNFKALQAIVQVGNPVAVEVLELTFDRNLFAGSTQPHPAHNASFLERLPNIGPSALQYDFYKECTAKTIDSAIIVQWCLEGAARVKNEWGIKAMDLYKNTPFRLDAIHYSGEASSLLAYQALEAGIRKYNQILKTNPKFEPPRRAFFWLAQVKTQKGLDAVLDLMNGPDSESANLVKLQIAASLP